MDKQYTSMGLISTLHSDDKNYWGDEHSFQQ